MLWGRLFLRGEVRVLEVTLNLKMTLGLIHLLEWGRIMIVTPLEMTLALTLLGRKTIVSSPAQLLLQKLL